MGSIICYSLIVWCAVVGAVHMLGLLWGSMLRPKSAKETVFLLPLHSGDRDIEYKLRWADWTLSWDSMPGSGQLLLVNFGADEETLRICSAYLHARPWAKICENDELGEIMSTSVCKSFKGVLY